MDRQPPPQPPQSDHGVRHLRSEPRDSMFLLAVVHRFDGGDQPVKVRNLSPGGMMAECPSGFGRGDPVEVELRGVGTVPGKIAWVASGRIGVQFDRVIDHRLARVTGPSPDQAQVRLVAPVRSVNRPRFR